MTRRLFCSAIAALPITIVSGDAQKGIVPADRRVALLIGNDAYPAARLVYPLHDVNVLETVLREHLAFNVQVAVNLDRVSMSRVINDFTDTLGTTDTVFFYFSGHGLSTTRGESLLLPVDFSARSEQDAEDQAISA